MFEIIVTEEVLNSKVDYDPVENRKYRKYRKFHKPSRGERIERFKAERKMHLARKAK